MTFDQKKEELVEILEDLRNARALISSRFHFTTGKFKRQRWFWNQYCAVGAIREVIKRRAPSAYFGEDMEHIYLGDVLQDSATKIFGVSIMRVNDEQGHTAVLQVYDDAIDTMESRILKFAEGGPTCPTLS